MLLFVLLVVSKFIHLTGCPIFETNKDGKDNIFLMPRVLQEGEMMNISVNVPNTTKKVGIVIMAVSENDDPKPIFTFKIDLANKIGISDPDEDNEVMDLANFISHETDTTLTISATFKRRSSATSSDADVLEIASYLFTVTKEVRIPNLDDMKFFIIEGENAKVSSLHFQYW